MRGLQIAAITYIIILILAILLLVPYTRRHQEKVTETNKSRIDKGGGPHPKIWLMRVPVVLNWITWVSLDRVQSQCAYTDKSQAVALVFGVVYTIYLSTPSSSTYDMVKSLIADVRNSRLTDAALCRSYRLDGDTAHGCDCSIRAIKVLLSDEPHFARVADSQLRRHWG